MNLDGDDIRTFDYQRRINVLIEKGRGLIRAAYDLAGECAKGDLAFGHVASKNFDTIQIDDRAVVAEQPHTQLCHSRGIVYRERSSEIGRDVFVGTGWTEAHHGGFIAVTVTELSLARGPGAVAKTARTPIRALIRPLIHIFPN